MLRSHIMQYTCFTLFNYDKQTLWRACMSGPWTACWCLMHDLDPQCGTGTAWHPHCGLRWTNLVETCFASMCQQCPLWFASSVLHAQIGPAVAVWRPDLEDFDLNLTMRSWDICFALHVGQHWTGLRMGHMPAFCSCLNCQDCSLLCNQNVQPRTCATWNPNPPAACVFRSRTTKNMSLKTHNFTVKKHRLCQKKQRGLIQYRAFTFASCSVFLLPGNIEYFGYAIGVVPLPHPLNLLSSCGDPEAGTILCFSFIGSSSPFYHSSLAFSSVSCLFLCLWTWICTNTSWSCISINISTNSVDKCTPRNKLLCKGLKVQTGRPWEEPRQTKWTKKLENCGCHRTGVGLNLHQYAGTVSALPFRATLQTRESTWPLQPSSLSAQEDESVTMSISVIAALTSIKAARMSLDVLTQHETHAGTRSLIWHIEFMRPRRVSFTKHAAVYPPSVHPSDGGESGPLTYSREEFLDPS